MEKESDMPLKGIIRTVGKAAKGARKFDKKMRGKVKKLIKSKVKRGSGVVRAARKYRPGSR